MQVSKKTPDLTQSRRQRGFAFLQIMAMLGVGAVLVGMLGYGFVSLTRTGSVTASKSQASDTLTQAKNSIVVLASDTDSDNIYEAPAWYSSATNCSTSTTVCPKTDGTGASAAGQLPLTVAPRTDAWGTPFGYCVWDNGSTTVSTGRLAGNSAATNTGSDVVFAVISAGPNRVFDTHCALIKTNYGTTTAYVSGDDGVRVVTHAQMIQGVGGTVFYGDPVANMASLPATGNVTGEMRLAKDTKAVYVWDGTTWYPANASSAAISATAGSNCDAYPLGSLGRDSSTGDLLICKP